MRIFNSKHQKLILQCYPPGKGVDKKPNPSELSYLLYYASTRRIKLEKVITFLDAKTQSDSYRSRAGNLQVTLSIILALIEKCSDNLNVFASRVCNILLAVLKTQDLALCRALVGTYGIFCSKLDSGLFTGDKEFVDSFCKLSEDLIQTGTTNATKQSPNHLEWKMVSLTSSRHLFGCLRYNSKLSERFTTICVPLLTKTISQNYSQHQIEQKLKSYMNVENESHALSKVILSKSVAQKYLLIDEDFENDTVTEADLSEESLRGLKTLFNTTLISQISEATRAIVKTDFNDESGWSSTFLELCTTWIPVQLRFVTLSTLLSSLNSLSQKASPKLPDFVNQKKYANYVLGLVSSNVNMIGLSISDVIQRLLSLQADLHLSQADFLSADEVNELSLIYSNSICNLSSHIYYFDQVPDSIVEVLIKIDSVLESNVHSEKSDSYKLSNLINTLIEDISNILGLLRKKPSTIARNHAKLEHWEISLTLLSPKFEFGGHEHKLPLTHEQIATIQLKYLTVFRDFLNNELISGDDKTNSRDAISTENLTIDATNFLRPDFHEYISNNDNFISHFFVYVTKFLSNNTPNFNVVTLLLETIKDLSNILGINFLSNFVPFFYHWQLSLHQNEYEESAKIRDTVAYIIMNYSLRTLDAKYPDSLQSYVANSPFYSDLLAHIEYRKLNGLWVDGLESKVLSKDVEKLGNAGLVQDENGALKFNTNKKTIQEFASGNAFTARWINPQRNLVLDIAKHKVEQRTESTNNHHDTSQNFSIGETSENISDFEDATDIDIGTRLPSQSNGLGLGNANDITSIHSGLIHNQQSNPKLNGNGNFTFSSDGSFSTSDTSKYYNSPRVSDMKELLVEPRSSLLRRTSTYDNSYILGSLEAPPASASPRSILSKQIATTDISSILGGLESEDDPQIVV